jgi:hypothetical protein
MPFSAKFHVEVVDGRDSRLFVLPGAKNVPGSAKDWIAIDHDGSWDDKPRWSPGRANPNGHWARRLP